MNIKPWLKTDSLPFLLIALMVMTRYHHFGNVLHLPDASLAVFFFAGFYRKKALLGFLLGLAALIDFIAIKNGTPAACISPAYLFLIPTYAALWFAGKTAVSFEIRNAINFVKSIGLLVLSTTVAFVISNVSFYLFSGNFGDLVWTDYIINIKQYYLPYLVSTLIYGSIGLTIAQLLKTIPALLSKLKTF